MAGMSTPVPLRAGMVADAALSWTPANKQQETTQQKEDPYGCGKGRRKDGRHRHAGRYSKPTAEVSQLQESLGTGGVVVSTETT